MLSRLRFVVAALPIVALLIYSGTSWTDEVTPPPASTETEQIGAHQPPEGHWQIPAQRLAVLQVKVEGAHASQVRHWLPQLIETQLAESGWMVLARGETMQEIQAEHHLTGVDPTTAPETGKLVGATAFLDLTARITVREVDAAINIGIFSLGGLAKAKVELSGRAVDTTTGIAYPVGQFQSEVSRLRRAAIILPSSKWIGAGFNYGAIRETMVGQAADDTAKKLVTRLNAMPWLIPGRAQQISDMPDVIYLTFPPDRLPQMGSEYGVYRDEQMIARVKVTGLEGNRACCQVLAQLDDIRASDVARPLVLEIPVELPAE